MRLKVKIFTGLMFSLRACTLSCQSEWINPQAETSEFAYFHAPGILSSETQMSRYCPRYIASTGEIITCPEGIETIGPRAGSCNFPEITLYPLKRDFLDTISPYGLINSIQFGILTLGNKKNNCTITGTSTNKSYSIAAHAVNFSAINLAQRKDISTFGKAFEKFKKQQATKSPKNTGYILYGNSRGAAVVINYAASLSESIYDKTIAALICEAPFDTVENTALLTDSIGTKIKVGLVTKAGVTAFVKNGTSPISVVSKISKDMPIALITSKADTIVPRKCVLNLYKELIKSGHTKVELLILEQSAHNDYAFGPEKAIYQNFMHSFYKKYNLPYIQKYSF